MKLAAVITGDIVNSRKILDKQELLVALKSTFAEIQENNNATLSFEIYRGDSFQLFLEKPEDAIRVAVLIRSGLKSKTRTGTGLKTKQLPLNKIWDTRLSIGIGAASFKADKIVESSGESFEISGNQLDNMKNSSERIRCSTIWKELNEQLGTIVKLSDAIISKWTIQASAAVHRHILYHETQQEIAKHLEVSQPAVHQRLTSANIDAIDSAIRYLTKTIRTKIHFD